MLVITMRLPVSPDPSAPPQEEVTEVCDDGTVRKYLQGIEMGCLTEEEAAREKEHEERRARDQRNDAELNLAWEALSPEESEVHTLLSEMIDAIEKTGVDVSYFPHAAQMVLVEYAKKLRKVI